MAWVTLLIMSAVLVAAAIFDIWTKQVPNRLTYPAIVLGFGWAALVGGWSGGASGATSNLLASLFAFAVAAVPFAVLFAARLVGGGDVKMMAALGAISARWEVVVAATFYGLIFGAILAVIIMIRRRIVIATLKRLASAAVMIAAKTTPDLETGKTEIPYTVGFCLGGILAGLEVLVGLHTPWAAFGP
jgi:prepilin peptidase CpaA